MERSKLMAERKQLSQSRKQWNDEQDLARWDTFYQQDNYHGHRLRSREKKVMEYLDSLNLPIGARILEYGYGAGVTSAKIYAKGFALTGIDISNKLCEIAIKNCQKVQANKGSFDFQVGNAENLNFPDNYFDCVIGIGFLQYLEYPVSCMKETQRVLKPGGHFIITQRNMYGLSSLDGPFKLLRSLVYLTTNRRYELRWQDTLLLDIAIAFTSILSPISKKAHKKRKAWLDHQKTGLVNKNALSYSRMQRLIKMGGLHTIRSGGAGYLTKKRKLFPKLASKWDQKLQKASESPNNAYLKKHGNSVVFMARKN
tara:strand:+ start:29315 stop:30250 length:936 start_codon:yes stop_codon:yes gene_type:complete